MLHYLENVILLTYKKVVVKVVVLMVKFVNLKVNKIWKQFVTNWAVIVDIIILIIILITIIHIC